MFSFYKYQGLGNDFLILDPRNDDIPKSLLLGDINSIRYLCDRHKGVGADGIILSMNPNGSEDAQMRIYNSDGTEAEMCGNGIRCLVKFLYDQRKISLDTNLIIKTLAGPIQASINALYEVKVDMGEPIFIPSKIPTTLPINEFGIPSFPLKLGQKIFHLYAASMGNPHLIVHLDNFSQLPLQEWGPRLEKHESFPAYTNVHFVQIVNRKELKLQVWERGCGPTLACGTGACAALVVTTTLDLCDPNVKVTLPGGDLNISWPDKQGSVLMTGPAKFVYKGKISI